MVVIERLCVLKDNLHHIIRVDINRDSNCSRKLEFWLQIFPISQHSDKFYDLIGFYKEVPPVSFPKKIYRTWCRA